MCRSVDPWEYGELRSLPVGAVLSHPLLSTSQHIFTQPFKATTLSAQVPARSGSSILGNQNPVSCDQKEAFWHESALYSPSSGVGSEELRSYGGVALTEMKDLDDQQ